MSDAVRKMSRAQTNIALAKVYEAIEAMRDIESLVIDNNREGASLSKRYRVLCNKLMRFETLLKSERAKLRLREGYYSRLDDDLV